MNWLKVGLANESDNGWVMNFFEEMAAIPSREISLITMDFRIKNEVGRPRETKAHSEP